MLEILQSIGHDAAGKVGAVAASIGICIFIEDIFPKGARLSFKDRLPGSVLSMAQAALWFLLLTPIQRIYQWLGIDAFVIIPLDSWVAPYGVLGQIAGAIALLMVADFLHYWWHRADHAWLPLWSIHAAHHAPRQLHAANNYGHPLQALTGFMFIAIPLSLFQMEGPIIPFAVISLIGLFEFLIHSPTSFHLGPVVRRVVVDNRFHRIHHSTEPRHLGKNFSIMFTLWDQMFGTAYFPAKDEWPEVGVDGLPEPSGVGELLVFPMQVMRLDHERRVNPCGPGRETRGGFERG